MEMEKGRLLDPLTRRQQIRNASAFEQDPLEFLRGQLRLQGDIFRFSNTLTVFQHPDHIHDIFADAHGAFALGAAEAAGEGGVTGGQAWLSARADSTHLLGTSAARASGESIAAAFQAHFARHAGSEIDVVDTLFDICGATVADLCAGPYGERLERAAADHLRALLAGAATSGLLPSWLPLPRARRIRATGAELAELIDDAAARGAPPDDPEARNFLQVLAARGDELGGRLPAMMRTMLVASLASPAAALAWGVRELALRPAEAAALREEIASVGLAGIVRDPLRAAPLTVAFLKEVLRFHSPAWLLQRDVVRPVTVGGVRLEPGERVAFSLYLLHHDERWWSEPWAFRPGRWLADAPAHAPRAYRPFGGGPRICAGVQLGMVQMVCGITTLLAHYDIDAPGAAAPPGRPEAVRAPSGLRATLRPRPAPVPPAGGGDGEGRKDGTTPNGTDTPLRGDRRRAAGPPLRTPGPDDR
ncbi:MULTISPECIES: cytochrome P450 [unclassified Streptomyces]|uniref:cytochrome P450 n=1 Tax=unclassified Streptomyces TaxID=2593676 RepID=UPI003801D856